jgi:hypothetical protein
VDGRDLCRVPLIRVLGFNQTQFVNCTKRKLATISKSKKKKGTTNVYFLDAIIFI